MKKLMKGMLVAVVMASLVFGLASCGGGSPSAVAKTFYAAVEKGDTKTIEKVTTSQTASLMALFGGMMKEEIKEYGKITGATEKIDGDKATVTLTFANGETDDVDLVKDGGKWKVNFSK